MHGRAKKDKKSRVTDADALAVFETAVLEGALLQAHQDALAAV